MLSNFTPRDVLIKEDLGFAKGHYLRKTYNTLSDAFADANNSDEIILIQLNTNRHELDKSYILTNNIDLTIKPQVILDLKGRYINCNNGSEIDVGNACTPIFNMLSDEFFMLSAVPVNL